jgi:regulator of sigma E protease
MDILATISNSALAFIVILSVLVFIHEYGHYIVAKWSGVRITDFSIGFGKEIYGWNDASGTRWKICWIPMGGYVKMFGDGGAASKTDKEELAKISKKDQQHTFFYKPLWIKSLIVMAGPAANFLLAIVILTGFLYTFGKTEATTTIRSVIAESAAEAAGLQADDAIKAIDGDVVTRFSDIQTAISLNTGSPLQFSVLRAGELQVIAVTPRMTGRKDLFGNDISVPMVGIASKTLQNKSLSLAAAFVESFPQTYDIAASTLKAIGQMVTGQRSLEEISGPIGIAKYSGQSFEQGLRVTFWFMALLSINLGLINLLPIPMLDGGHLLFYIIEGVSGRPLAQKIQTFGYRIGFSLVASLAAFAIVNDVIKLF